MSLVSKVVSQGSAVDGPQSCAGIPPGPGGVPVYGRAVLALRHTVVARHHIAKHFCGQIRIEFRGEFAHRLTLGLVDAGEKSGIQGGDCACAPDWAPLPVNEDEIYG